jgi:hypothetical protein
MSAKAKWSCDEIVILMPYGLAFLDLRWIENSNGDNEFELFDFAMATTKLLPSLFWQTTRWRVQIKETEPV